METFYVTLDKKVTTWIRTTVSVKAGSYEKAVKKVVESIDNNGDCNNLSIIDYEELPESEEFITPFENNHSPTIEIMKNYEVIWNNVDGYTEKPE